MNVDFSKKDGGAGASPAPVIDIETKTEPATDSGDGLGEVSVLATTMPSPNMVSDSLPGFRDVMFPRVNIVQNLGELKDTFTPGEIVFGKQTVLFTPPTRPTVDKATGNITVPGKPGTPPVILTVLGITQKRFHEIVVGGMGGQIVNSEAEVRANGGTLDYKEWELKKASGMKRFGPMVDLLVVVRRPEYVADDDTVFNFNADGHKYALGLWSLQKTSYTEGYKKILAFNRLAGVLKSGYPTHSFALSTREQSYTGNKLAHVPVLIPSGKSTPAFLEFVNAIINPAG